MGSLLVLLEETMLILNLWVLIVSSIMDDRRGWSSKTMDENEGNVRTPWTYQGVYTSIAMHLFDAGLEHNIIPILKNIKPMRFTQNNTRMELWTDVTRTATRTAMVVINAIRSRSCQIFFGSSAKSDHLRLDWTLAAVSVHTCGIPYGLRRIYDIMVGHRP